jgi:hypothetical protein
MKHDRASLHHMTHAAPLRTLEWSFTRTSNLVRALARKPGLDLVARRAETAGSLSFAARKPER